MASNKKQEADEKQFSAALLKRAESLEKQTAEHIQDYNGIGKNFAAATDSDLEFIRSTLAASTNKIQRAVGETGEGDFSSFFVEVIAQEENSKNKNFLRPKTSTRRFINVNKALETLDSHQVQTLLSAESGRIQNYIDYRRIVDMIPQLSQVLD